ncbi:MAG: MATE family efflux transporter [Acidobacteriota bacterium]
MLSENPPYPSVLRMAAPLVVSFVMRALFTFVDTAYAATLGDAAVAAIGLTVPFEFMMIALWVGLSTGLTSCLSRAMGAREGRNIESYVRTSWVLVLWITPLFALTGLGIWLLAPRTGLDADVARSFQIYGTTLVVGSALTSFWSVIPDSLIKAHHDTKSTMWAGIWSNVINVTLNTIFLFVFHWGMFGIAFSTVLGRIGGLTYAILRARAHEDRRQSTGRDTSPAVDTSPYRSILSLAIPSSLTFALMSGESAVVNALLATLPAATEAIAAYSIFYRVLLFAMNPVIACGVAMLPYAAKRFGERDLAGLRRGLRECAVASTVYAVVLVGPALLIGSHWIAGWLAESPITRQFTEVLLRFVPLMVLLGSPFLLVRPVFEAMGRGRPGLLVAFVRYALLTFPAAWAGMHLATSLGHPPIYGLVTGLVLVAAISSAIFLIWLRSTLQTGESLPPLPAAAPPEPETT